MLFRSYQTPSGAAGSGEHGTPDIVQELELARKEIDYLKKIIHLMEEKARLLQAMQSNSSPENQQESRQKENGVAQKTIALF